jgi:carbon dioxide concentrating mechanism protein CcmN
MSLLPLQPATQADTYILGNVRIDPSAAIAPGVILQAAPECQITIAAGVCLGMGTIICASYGDIEVGAGVILGAGVLILGKAKIGANSCIGAATTIYNATVEPMQFVRAGTVLGDTSRDLKQVTQVTQGEEEIESEAETEIAESQPAAPPGETPAAVPPENGQQPTETETLAPKPKDSHVYGRAQVNQMLLSLFPHRQNLHSQNGSSPGN